MLLGGRHGSPAHILDHVRLTRETLVQMYADDTVKGVFAPKCGTHVRLETLAGSGVETTRDPLDTPPFLLAPGTLETFEEAPWSWINLGGPILPARQIDRPGVFGVSGC